MNWLKTGDTYLVRLDQGDEILSSIVRFANDRRIDLAFVSGIGLAADVTIGYFSVDSRSYVRREMPGTFEIVSLSGNISLKDGQPYPHLHIVLSGPDFQAVAGHFFGGTVAATCELIVRPLHGMVLRKKDETTGLLLWEL